MRPGKHRRVHSPGSFDWRTWWEYHKELFLYRGSRHYETTGSHDKALQGAVNDMALALECHATEVDDSRLRAESALALARLGDAIPFDALEATLDAAEKDETELAVRTVMALASHGGASGRAALLEILIDTRFPSVVQAIAAAGLGVAGPLDSKAVRILIDSCRRPEHDDFHAACYFALGSSRAPLGVAFLKERAKSETSLVKQSLLLSALALSRDPSATPIFLEKSRSLDYHVRWSAITGLGELLDGTGTLTGDTADDAGYDASLLAKQRAIAIKHLVALTRKATDDRVRSFAAIALGRIGGNDAVNSLGTLARETKGHLRAATCIALALASTPKAEDAMVRLLLDKSETASTRAAGALALGIQGRATSRARRVLHGALATHNGPDVRRYAAIALGMLHDVPAVPAMVEMLNQRKAEPKVRIGAARGLALVGSASAIQAVQNAVERERTPEGKIALLRTLGACPNARPLGYLESLISRESTSDLSAVAAHVIGHVRACHEPPPFAKLLSNWNYFLRIKPFDVLHEFI